MKEGIHPDYHPVVFHDVGSGVKFLPRSTIASKDKVKLEHGNAYPQIAVDISSASHPFFTGKMKFIDAAGRVEKFQKKYGWAKKDEEGK